MGNGTLGTRNYTTVTPRYITVTPLFHHSDLRDLRELLDFHGLTDGQTNFCFKVRTSPQPELLTD